MKDFSMVLRDNARSREITNVVSFVGEDASGSFGILAGHATMMTSLVFGLARFRLEEDNWQYLALPGGIVHFQDNVLRLNTRRFMVGYDYEDMSRVLVEKLAEEERNLAEMKGTLHNIEKQVLRQMVEMGKAGTRLLPDYE